RKVLAILAGAIVSYFLSILLAMGIGYLLFSIDTTFGDRAFTLVLYSIFVVPAIVAFITGGIVTAMISTSHETQNAVLAATVATAVGWINDVPDLEYLWIFVVSSILTVSCGWLGAYIFVRRRDRDGVS
ncbi:MAG: hypothetical protein AAF497_04245, partial [Planctomycetota bacterium]